YVGQCLALFQKNSRDEVGIGVEFKDCARRVGVGVTRRIEAVARWPLTRRAIRIDPSLSRRARPALRRGRLRRHQSAAARNALVRRCILLRERWNATQHLSAAGAREDKCSHRTRLHEKSEIRRPRGLTAISSALRGGRVVTVKTPLYASPAFEPEPLVLRSIQLTS